MSAASTDPLVAVEDLHTYYGKSHILHGVSLTVGKGEVVGLLGRNGVGKSTTLKTIMGLGPPVPGQVVVAASAFTGCRRTNWRGSASAMCRRIGASSACSPSWRTSAPVSTATA
jgi:ABC-type branched-subunit amino acid transport system ATPase component